MQKAVDPIGGARPDYEIFAGLAGELGFESDFTENRDEAEWLEVMYDTVRKQAAAEHIELPDFDEFWAGEGERLALDDDDRVAFAEFGTTRTSIHSELRRARSRSSPRRSIPSGTTIVPGTRCGSNRSSGSARSHPSFRCI